MNDINKNCFWKGESNARENICLILIAQFPLFSFILYFISLKFFVFPVGKFLRRISEMKNVHKNMLKQLADRRNCSRVSDFISLLEARFVFHGTPGWENARAACIMKTS